MRTITELLAGGCVSVVAIESLDKVVESTVASLPHISTQQNL